MAIKTIELKNNKKWETSHIITDETEIYKSLANDMINKKLNNCAYIKSIKRTPLYDGTHKITVTYNNDCRAIYHVAEH